MELSIYTSKITKLNHRILLTNKKINVNSFNTSDGKVNLDSITNAKI